MILPIVILILIVLVVSLLISFLYYVFIPSIKLDEKYVDDPIIPANKKTFLIQEDVYFDKTDNRAIVLCSSKKETKLKRTPFNKSFTCFMASANFGTGIDCKYGCIGLGDCLKVCPQQAIIIENNTAVITKNCCGCGKCLNICPQNIITLIPKETKSIKLCNCKEDELTSCSKKMAEENVVWNDKKDFKLWSYCYRIIKRIFR